MKHAARQVSPHGYSNGRVVRINPGIRKDFSYRRAAIAEPANLSDVAGCEFLVSA
jgi:hypothetical protein